MRLAPRRGEVFGSIFAVAGFEERRPGRYWQRKSASTRDEIFGCFHASNFGKKLGISGKKFGYPAFSCVGTPFGVAQSRGRDQVAVDPYKCLTERRAWLFGLRLS